ncbi:MAG TPA: C45 family peptidase [Nitriliruptorales bacterium]
MTDRSCPTVRVEGDARQRGQAHGEALRGAIAEGLGRWHDALAAETGADPVSYLRDFVATTDFVPSIRRWTPQLLEEVRGIADGADQPFQAVLAYNLMDEEWLHHLRRRDVPPADEPHHCSTVGLRPAPGRPTLVSQNMDLPQHFDGSQIVLHAVPDDGLPEVLVLTAAGLIATTGLNSAGVGMCMNAVVQLDNEPHGLPVAFVIRGVLERTSRAEAVEFIRSVQHASGQVYTVGDPTGVTGLECSARGVVEYAPEGPALAHTNHPLVSDHMQQHLRRMAAAADGVESATLNSKQRLALLDERMAAEPQPDAVLDVLRDRTVPVCRVADDSGAVTFGTVLMELGDEPVLAFTPGPPTEEALRELRF